ncbi:MULTISPECIES: 4-hydroxybenzoate octaprenyltransferase [unclassified Aureimonas]|uniref:4-hydroxybenzoate octaprenyltransferase n=1 Tax=unclassified Aureimonas TaxID=2615206 RepID=UPI0006FC08BB|nr:MULTISPECIES: 4-hydroxybenzoate octaprenyltransferase [unclassified Aureimonas]KQT65123.1 4-hydroxybenzoate octaprenyltransferase [Aureimonas sp. Leaf427]KQT76227.1 4-hydroxybenzoate octaprenyltransferase [Aureimonas sp. Leaf460]
MSNRPHEAVTGGAVADAAAANWVHRFLPRALWPYAQLARWDRPIGWQLLLWPCWWSAALAPQLIAPTALTTGLPNVWHLVLFFVGSVAMRGAGCTYNDLVDARIDAKVARTRSRPLPSGRVTKRQAKLFLVLQALVGFLVLVQFNLFAIVLGLSSLGFVAVYPFLKRVTDWPQLGLGLAFSWGALMGWAALWGSLSLSPVLLYFGAIAWTVGYDTIYAHQDKEDDALIGVRSTARLFGRKTKPALAILYGTALALFAGAFVTASTGLWWGPSWPAYAGLAVGAAQMFWQIRSLDIDDPDQCIRLFRSNNRFGAIVFFGLVLSALWSLSFPLPQ